MIIIDTRLFLNLPSITSSGAMLVAVLLTTKIVLSVWDKIQIVLVMSSVLLVAYVLMLVASKVNLLIGSSGARVVSRVMGLIQSSIATTNILLGLSEYFNVIQYKNRLIQLKRVAASLLTLNSEAFCRQDHRIFAIMRYYC